MKVKLQHQDGVEGPWVEINTLDDLFKLFEPHFDIRFVPEIGIVTGRWYHRDYKREVPKVTYKGITWEFDPEHNAYMKQESDEPQIIS